MVCSAAGMQMMRSAMTTNNGHLMGQQRPFGARRRAGGLKLAAKGPSALPSCSEAARASDIELGLH